MAFLPNDPAGASGPSISNAVNAIAAGAKGISGGSQDSSSTSTAMTASDLQHFIFWGVGAVALITLADFLPRQTILLTGVIGLSVVLRFSDRLQQVIASTTGTATGTQSAGPGDAPSATPRGRGTPAGSDAPAGANSSGLGRGNGAGNARTTYRSNVVRYPESPFMRDLIRTKGGRIA